MMQFFEKFPKFWRKNPKSSRTGKASRTLSLEACERRHMLFAPTELGEGEVGPLAMPAFSLVDINPSSTSFNQPVSPRDYLGQVSSWYFGHAT